MVSTKRHYNFKKIDFLLITSILLLSTSAMDRIDFLSGQGSFILTPSIIFLVIFFVLYLYKLIRCKWTLTVSKNLVEYLKAILLLNATVILSIPFSADIIISARRTIQFVLFSLGGFLAVNYLYLKCRDAYKEIIVNCILFQCYAYFIFSLLDEIMWLNPQIHQIVEGSTSIFNSALSSYGPYIVRTRGLSGDSNRAGIFIVLCLFILIEFAKPSLLKKISIIICCIMILFTISRTAMLCLAILLVFNIYKIKYITNHNFFKFLIGCVITIAVIMWLLTLPTIKNAFDILISRFTNRQEESANIHVSLIEFGINKAFGNLKYLLVGNGYGASYTILKDYFNTKYANFHNGYVTFLVECGIFSLICFIYVIVNPFLINNKCLPAVVVIALANISYHTITEPYIWMFLPIFCLPIFEKNINRSVTYG